VLASNVVALPVPASVAAQAWPDEWVADSAFNSVWSRADEPVAGGAVQRSWLWGPTPFAVANEAYAESSTGRRLVEYFDKARMEVNDPSVDRASPWFVTSGLLVYEMITGQVQTGNNRFDPRPPAALPVAGDASSPSAPTYASFARNTGGVANQQGKAADQRIGKDGTISPAGQGVPSDPGLFGFTYYDDVSRHNVPAVFRDWMLQRGAVQEGGRLVQAQLMDPLFVLGRPVTEAYWADVLVGGQPATVLVQLFERRALTYNPNNPAAWRVEMANVGRAYYDWRYAGSKPEPAVAAQVVREGLRVRGWNWPPGVAVAVQVDLPGGPQPLAGPMSATPDAAGRFSLLVPSNPALEGALLSGANVQVKAQGGQAQAALPIAGKALGGPVQLEGVITQVSAGAAGVPSVRMRARDGQEWSVELSAGSALHYSEGDTAPASALQPGIAVVVSGQAVGGSVRAIEVRLYSLSKTGARVGYSWQPPSNTFRVSGTGWPAEKEVKFSLAPLNSEGPPAFHTARTDSRGNLSTSFPVPDANSVPAGRTWIFAVCTEGNRLLALVAVPFELPPPGPDSSEPPQLFASTAAGEQRGARGSYCWRTRCVDYRGVPLPGDALAAGPGEVVALRSQFGPDPRAGLTPDNFSAQVFTYATPPGQVTEIDGIPFFTPRAEPVHSATGDTGRPFSVTLPQSLPAGKYVLIVQVTWPDPAGGHGDAVYGFVLEVR
jgi:hypothetical protein